MLQVHDRLGDFEIIHLLGKGGMGEVYEARQFNPERRVALKVLAPWLADDDDALRRFWKEAEVPANLDHPGIVRIISNGKTDSGVAYYAMHLVRGISLAEMIKRTSATPVSDAATRTVEVAATPSMQPPSTSAEAPPPSPNFALESSPQILKDYRTDRFTTLARIGVQVARALAYAHQEGHVHRDIKPSNLMVDHHDHVYLVDFGLTRALEAAAGGGTQIGVVIGTPWYMSPEQADGKQVDARCDIYSLGLTLYELATQGLGPWTANRDDKQSVLAQVRAGQALPLRTLAPGIPPALEHIIVKAMSLRSQKRYASAAELAKDLEAFLGIQSKHTPHSYKHVIGARPRRWPLWFGGAAALVAIALAVAAFVNRDRQPGGDPENAGDSGKIKRKLDRTAAFPESLRDPKNVRIAVPLLDNKSAPRWSERLHGTGKLSALNNHFALAENTILALADPDTTHFEFTMDPAQMESAVDMGVFFGWRRRDEESREPYRFFVIKWEDQPVVGYPFGRLSIGTTWLIKGNALNADSIEWLKVLPGGKGTLALAQKARNDWHTLKLTVLGDNFTVTVPKKPSLSFSLTELKRLDPERFDGMNTAGAVGVWCKNKVAIFRNATLTPLPAE